MTSVYLTRSDLDLMKIISADILSGGVIFVSFSHKWYGALLTAVLKFHMYIGGQDDKWAVTMTVYPKDDVIVSAWVENTLKLNLITLFGSLMKKKMRGQRWTS